ncbi:MAG: DUF2520 domain-containing protein [Actinobacteria bacterium]|nr:DUF2520 domain-containing protein [Actinomycetota bacterium]
MTVAVRFRTIGPGRAGRSLAIALERAGWEHVGYLGRGDDVSAAADGVDLVVIATPDGAVADAAASIEPRSGVVVAHLAGSLGLEALAPHERRGALHPLMSLPDPELGARRLASGAWFAVAGDPLVERIVDDLGGRRFTVADADRAEYHATAAIASNHLVALLGQVVRLAQQIDVPPEAYLDLATATLANVVELGPRAALTGPVARGDWDTVARHLDALPADERVTYVTLAAAAARLVEREVPERFLAGASSAETPPASRPAGSADPPHRPGGSPAPADRERS